MWGRAPSASLILEGFLEAAAQRVSSVPLSPGRVTFSLGASVSSCQEEAGPPVNGAPLHPHLCPRFPSPCLEVLAMAGGQCDLQREDRSGRRLPDFRMGSGDF